VVFTLPEPAQVIDTPCLLLGGDDNYSHWVTRNLIKLSLVADRPELAALPMLVNADLRRFQHQWLGLLDIGEDRLIPIERKGVVRCRRLVVPTVLRNRPGMRSGMDWLRARVAQCMTPEPDAHELLFLSRADSALRVLVNEQEVVAALEQRGFRVIVAGNLSVREQIAAFSGARVIVAAHGAGLTNLVFAPAHARVLELASGAVQHMIDFEVIARERGLVYRRVVSRDYTGTQAPGSNPMHRDYRVDVKAVLEALDGLL
jgi:capsular polysaccharide biosynthesis protein